MIDTDGSEQLDMYEGYQALYCLVDAGVCTEEEAEMTFEFIGGYAGDDD